ncbi:hypothetical protein AB0I93_14365 [Streptomyces sp. NPDC049967]|uniref:hypothetical protein n=1 Tax=unclassified Streptomyces TaxID=2593676 RepID=UPI00343A631B
MSNGYPPPQQPGPQQPPQWGQQPYPPQPGPAWTGPAPLPPPKKTNRAGLFAILGCSGVLVLAVVGGVVALVSSGGSDKGEASGSGKVTTSPSAPAVSKDPSKKAPAPGGAEADVKVTGCVVNSSTTWPAADVEIVNHSGSKANYIISVEFVDGSGTRLGEGAAAANDVAVGQRVKEKAQGLAETSGKVSCRVLKVTRYPSG